MKKINGTVRVQFVEMQTDSQMATWRAALATLAIVIERYEMQQREVEGQALDNLSLSTTA